MEVTVGFRDCQKKRKIQKKTKKLTLHITLYIQHPARQRNGNNTVFFVISQPLAYSSFLPLLSLQREARIEMFSSLSSLSLIIMCDFSVTELIPLLASDRTDVRLQSLQIAAQIVDSTNVSELCKDEVFSSIVTALDHVDLRVHSATLIINIIAEQGDVSQTTLIMEKAVDFLSSNCPKEHVNIYLILLTNLTIPEDICDHFMTYCTKKDSAQKLIDQFLAYNPQTVEGDDILDDYSESDVWQYFSSVLCNICRVDAGRRLLLSVSTGNMAACLKQVYMIVTPTLRVHIDYDYDY